MLMHNLDYLALIEKEKELQGQASAKRSPRRQAKTVKPDAPDSTVGPRSTYIGCRMHPHYKILILVTSMVMLLLFIQKLRTPDRGPSVPCPCTPKNDSYLEYLNTLQASYFPSPTYTAFPKATYKALKLEKLEVLAFSSWPSSPSSLAYPRLPLSSSSPSSSSSSSLSSSSSVVVGRTLSQIRTERSLREGEAVFVNDRREFVNGKAVSVNDGTEYVNGKVVSVNEQTESVNGEAVFVNDKVVSVNDKVVFVNDRSESVNGKAVSVNDRTASMGWITSEKEGADGSKSSLKESPITTEVNTEGKSKLFTTKEERLEAHRTTANSSSSIPLSISSARAKHHKQGRSTSPSSASSASSFFSAAEASYSSWPSDASFVISKEEHCRQYTYELSLNRLVEGCEWATFRDVTDAVLGPDDVVTLVTMTDLFGMDGFFKLMEYWTGPISVVIYLDNSDLVQCMERLVQLRDNVYVTLVIRNGLHYPLNFLRNHAVTGCRTQCCFLMDDGFLPSMETERNLIEQCRTLPDKQVLVVPAFTSVAQSATTVLAGKSHLLDNMMHIEIGKSNSFVNVDEWRDAKSTYKASYVLGNDPFLLIQNNMILPYSEVFMDDIYGSTAFHLLLLSKGMTYHVLHNSFVVQSHTASASRGDEALHEHCSYKVWNTWLPFVIASTGMDINKWIPVNSEDP